MSEKTEFEKLRQLLELKGRNLIIFNLTQHITSAEQKVEGVIDPSSDERKQIRKLLTFETIPDRDEIGKRVQGLLNIIIDHRSECSAVMIGGAPFLMPSLQRRIHELGLDPLYAFSKRRIEEKDGKKIAIFHHEGFVAPYPLLPGGPDYGWSGD